jgi:6-pyruvoyltetrahydropterin/6-carboxytetrahydropterin synthase
MLTRQRGSAGGWSVTVERGRLGFAAAHMATFGRDLEPLHGHNYAVAVTVTGDLTADAWVIDFGVLKRLAREVCEELDHRVILQTESPALCLTLVDGAFEAVFGNRAYRFPASDVVPLAADNSTAERLAEFLWGRLRDGLAQANATNIKTLAVTIEEAPGQSASFEADLAIM